MKSVCKSVWDDTTSHQKLLMLEQVESDVFNGCYHNTASDVWGNLTAEYWHITGQIDGCVKS